MHVGISFGEMAQWIILKKRPDAIWNIFLNILSINIQTFYNMTTMRWKEYMMNLLLLSVLRDSNLSAAMWQEAVVREFDDESKEYRIDTIWYHLQNMRSSVGNNNRFQLLFHVAKLVLITPQSNAGIEKVFSLVNKK